MQERFHEGQKQELSAERLLFNLQNDYPQHSCGVVINRLSLVASGRLTQEQFFAELRTEPILDVTEYIDLFCKKFNFSPPKKIPNDVQEKIDKINSIVDALKHALQQETDLKMIYAITVRFEAEAGFRLRHLKHFEQ
jgi:hypothetical protein